MIILVINLIVVIKGHLITRIVKYILVIGTIEAKVIHIIVTAMIICFTKIAFEINL